MSDAFNTPVSVDPRLLEVLVCPVTRGRLTYDRDANELISAGAKLAYPIREGVPSCWLRKRVRSTDSILRSSPRKRGPSALGDPRITRFRSQSNALPSDRTGSPLSRG